MKKVNEIIAAKSGRIRRTPDGQADALAQLDVELHSSKPVLI